MKTVVEELKRRTAIYPQLSKLPNGVRFVQQAGFKETKALKKYCAYLSSGKLIGTNLGNSLKTARVGALNELNRQLRETNFIWGNSCKTENYKKIIHQTDIKPTNFVPSNENATCTCTDYNEGQCYNCLNGAHEWCEAKGRKKCKKGNAKQMGIKLIFKE